MINFPSSYTLQNSSIMSLHNKLEFQRYLHTNTIASTPIISKAFRPEGCLEAKQIKKKGHFIEGSNMESFLLESKQSWPLAFSEACQEYLDNLNLNLEGRVILQDSKKQDRVRGRSLDITKGKCRDRSLTPGGVKDSKESKWEKEADIASMLIEEIITNFEHLHENILFSDLYEGEVKELMNKLLKNNKKSEISIIIKNSTVIVLVNTLKYFLKRLGMLIPTILSEQLLLLKSVIDCSDEVKVVRQTHLTAVQVMLFNMIPKSRLLLRKLLFLLNLFYKTAKQSMTKSKLIEWIRLSLFDGPVDPIRQDLCRNFIVLSDRLFKVPAGLVESVKEKVNGRISKGVVISLPQTQRQSIVTSQSKQNKIEITLESFKRITSPNRATVENPLLKSKKRLSFTEISKKICKRALSPLRPTKGSYNIDNYYSHTKRSKLSE